MSPTSIKGVHRLRRRRRSGVASSRFGGSTGLVRSSAALPSSGWRGRMGLSLRRHNTCYVHIDPRALYQSRAGEIQDQAVRQQLQVNGAARDLASADALAVPSRRIPGSIPEERNRENIAAVTKRHRRNAVILRLGTADSIICRIPCDVGKSADAGDEIVCHKSRRITSP